MTRNMRWGLIGATTISREWMAAAIRAAGGEIIGTRRAVSGQWPALTACGTPATQCRTGFAAVRPPANAPRRRGARR